jgi:hypothetical protein
MNHAAEIHDACFGSGAWLGGMPAEDRIACGSPSRMPIRSRTRIANRAGYGHALGNDRCLYNGIPVGAGFHLEGPSFPSRYRLGTGTLTFSQCPRRP